MNSPLFRRVVVYSALVVGLCSMKSYAGAADVVFSEKQEIATFFAAPFNGLLHLYRNVLRKARPAVCQMYPSDSAYAVQSIRDHGPAKGILMASDRLQRCGNDLKNYDTVIIEGRPFYSDPVR